MILVEKFIPSATLEIRFIPPISSDLATRVAAALMDEIRLSGSPGPTAEVFVRHDYAAISLEDVELSEMTVEAYGMLLDKLQKIGQQMVVDAR